MSPEYYVTGKAQFAPHTAAALFPMNSASNRPANPYPQFNDFGEARAYLNFIRQTSWNSIEHVIKFLSDTLQEKTNYIEALRAEFTASQNASNAKLYSMDQTIKQLERQLQEKDAIVHDRNSKVQQLQQRCDVEFEESHRMRTKISSAEQSFRSLLAQNEQLRLNLTQAEQQLQLQQQQQKQSVTSLEFNLTEEQEKELRVHIEEEITKRATEVSAKAKEKIAQTFKRWHDRMKELEEQLEASRARNDKNDTSDKLVRRQSVSHPNSHAVIRADSPLPPQDRSDNIADELNSINQQHNVVSDGV